MFYLIVELGPTDINSSATICRRKRSKCSISRMIRTNSTISIPIRSIHQWPNSYAHGWMNCGKNW